MAARPLPGKSPELSRYLSEEEITSFRQAYRGFTHKTRELYDKRPVHTIPFDHCYKMAAYLHSINAPRPVVFAALGAGLLGGSERRLTEEYLHSIPLAKSENRFKFEDETSSIMGAFSDIMQSPDLSANQRGLATAAENPYNLSASLLRSVDFLFTLQDHWNDDPQYRDLARNWYSPFTYAMGHHRLHEDLNDRLFELGEPGKHKEFTQLMSQHRAAVDQSDEFAQFRKDLGEQLRENGLKEGVDYIVQDRHKSPASTYYKMGGNLSNLENVPDMYGLRIILNSHRSGGIITAPDKKITEARCYIAKRALDKVIKSNPQLAIINPKNVDDYIKNPKKPKDSLNLLENTDDLPPGYQGINVPFVHRGIPMEISPGKVMPAHLEVQIMGDFHHENNEFGWGSRAEYKYELPPHAAVLLNAIGQAAHHDQSVVKAIGRTNRLLKALKDATKSSRG